MLMPLMLSFQKLQFELSYRLLKLLHHFGGLKRGGGRVGEERRNAPQLLLFISFMNKDMVDLGRGQSVFLTQVAQVHLVLGREPLHTLLVLISLLLLLLLQNQVSGRAGRKD